MSTEILAPTSPAPPVAPATGPQTPWAPWAVRPWGPWATLGFCILLGLAEAIALFFSIALTPWLKDAVPPDSVGVEAVEVGAIEASFGASLHVTNIASGLVVVPFIVGFAGLRSGLSVREYLGLRWPTWRQGITWTLALLVLIVAESLAAQLVGYSGSSWVLRATSWLPLAWVSTVIVGPLAEEVMFRGFLLPGLAHSRLGWAGAILVSSLLFAHIHPNLGLFAYAWFFTFGAMMALVRITTGSLYLACWLHMLTNALVMSAIELKLWAAR